MLEKLYQWICGFVFISFSGKNAKRCLNLCVRQKIPVWNIHTVSDDELRFYMSLKDLRKTKELLRKTKTRIRIHRKCGFPFIRHRYRKRVLFPTAFCLAFFFFWLNSQYIWKIEINGNSYLSEDVLIGYLNEKKSGFGCRKSDIDCNRLKLDFREDFEQIIWASAHMKGTKLVIELQENLTPKTESESETKDCYDLVAKADAKILSIITRNGTPAVTANQEVKKGDVLVSGKQEIRNDNGEVGSYFYLSADADVIGQVLYSYQDQIDRTIKEKIYTGRKKQSFYIRIRNKLLETPVYLKTFSYYHTQNENRQLHISQNYYLPVYVGIIRFREYEFREKERSLEEIKKIAEENYQKYQNELQKKGILVLKKDLKMEKEGAIYRISGTLTTRESIAEKKVIPYSEWKKEGTADESD